MSERKPFNEYPSWVMEVIEKLRASEGYMQLPAADQNQATSIRHTFNRARAQLRREVKTSPEGLELMDLVNDIYVRVTNLATPGLKGVYVVEFMRLGLAIMADESRPSKRGIPSPLREIRGDMALEDIDKALAKQPQHLDEGDEALAKLFNIDLNKDKEEGK